MSVNPEPDVWRINALFACKTVYDMHSWLVDQGISSCIDALHSLLSGFRDNYEKALVVDFAIRHGGITLRNVGKKA